VTVKAKADVAKNAAAMAMSLRMGGSPWLNRYVRQMRTRMKPRYAGNARWVVKLCAGMD